MTQPTDWILPVTLVVVVWTVTRKIDKKWLKNNLRACSFIQIMPLPLMAPGEGALIPFMMFGGIFVGLVWLLAIGVVYFVRETKIS